MEKHLLKCVATVVTAITCIASANAAEYVAGIVTDAEISHNDNIRMVQNDKTAVKKYSLSPRLTLGANTETDRLKLDSTLDLNRYDKNEFNSNDRSVSLTYTHHFENSSAGIDTNYIHNTTLTSELLTSGRIGAKADRAELYSIAPNWTYTFNENNVFRLDTSYTTQNYESAVYTGYENIGAGINWMHLLNERIKLIVAASYSDYKSDDLPYPGLPSGFLEYSTRTKTRDLQLGVEYQFSEQISLSGRLGRSRNDTTYPVDDISNICSILNFLCATESHNVNYGSTAQLNSVWTNERHEINLSASKATQPTSNGYAVDSIRVSSTWSYRVSELDKISAAISMVRNRAINTDNAVQNSSLADRNYGAATLRYQRSLTENWLVSTSYEYSENKYIDTDYHASSRMYSVGVTYRPQQWLWSR